MKYTSGSPSNSGEAIVDSEVNCAKDNKSSLFISSSSSSSWFCSLSVFLIISSSFKNYTTSAKILSSFFMLLSLFLSIQSTINYFSVEEC